MDTTLTMGDDFAREGLLRGDVLDRVRAVMNGAQVQPTGTTSTSQPPATALSADQPANPPTATANDSTNTVPKDPIDKVKRRVTGATDAEEEDDDFVVEDEDGEAIEVREPTPRKPREGQSPLERAAKDLLPLTPHNHDSD